MFGWHRQLNGHEFEQTLRGREGQGGLACFSLWGRRIRHDLVTEQLQQSSRAGFATNGYVNVVNLLNLLRIKFQEKEISTHSSIIAWKSPWTEEPGWLQSMGLHD